MSERRPATTIGELDIHLGNVMDQIEKLNENVRSVETALSRLATRDYVDEQVRLVNQKIQDGKPTTQLIQFAKVAAAITAVLAFLGMSYEVASAVKEIRNSSRVAGPR